MDCADYRLYCNGDSDGNGNDLLFGVLDKKSVLEFDFQDAFVGRKQKWDSKWSPTQSINLLFVLWRTSRWADFKEQINVYLAMDIDFS